MNRNRIENIRHALNIPTDTARQVDSWIEGETAPLVRALKQAVEALESLSPQYRNLCRAVKPDHASRIDNAITNGRTELARHEEG